MKKSSMNTSRNLSTMSEKILSIHRWNVAGALHNPKGMRLYTNVPNGHVNVIFS